MKFIQLTFPNGQSLALNPAQVESIQPKQILPEGDYIVGRSKATEGSTVHTIGGSNYTVREPVDLVVQITTQAMGEQVNFAKQGTRPMMPPRGV